MALSEDRTKIRFLVDKGGVEIFGCEGRKIMTTPWLLNMNERYVAVSSADEAGAQVEEICLRKLQL